MHLLIKQDIPFGYGQHLPQLWQLQLSMDLAPASPKQASFMSFVCTRVVGPVFQIWQSDSSVVDQTCAAAEREADRAASSLTHRPCAASEAACSASAAPPSAACTSALGARAARSASPSAVRTLRPVGVHSGMCCSQSPL